eukprot:scaffold4370_cov317-Prasinococcus_capsulatus_cf.AAC.1
MFIAASSVTRKRKTYGSATRSTNSADWQDVQVTVVREPWIRGCFTATVDSRLHDTHTGPRNDTRVNGTASPSTTSTHVAVNDRIADVRLGGDTNLPLTCRSGSTRRTCDSRSKYAGGRAADRRPHAPIGSRAPSRQSGCLPQPYAL